MRYQLPKIHEQRVPCLLENHLLRRAWGTEGNGAERPERSTHGTRHRKLGCGSATFDFPAIPSMNKVLVMELARCEYTQRRENVIAVGNQSRSVRPASGWVCCRLISNAG